MKDLPVLVMIGFLIALAPVIDRPSRSKLQVAYARVRGFIRKTLLKSLDEKKSVDRKTQPNAAEALENLQAERQGVIDEARALPLLDGVLYVLLSRSTFGLTEVFPSAIEVQLEEARARSLRLLESAYIAADAILDAKFANSAAVRVQLASEHPGFSPRSYERVIDRGLFLAR
jgi:hypothetical protein